MSVLQAVLFLVQVLVMSAGVTTTAGLCDTVRHVTVASHSQIEARGLSNHYEAPGVNVPTLNSHILNECELLGFQLPVCTRSFVLVLRLVANTMKEHDDHTEIRSHGIFRRATCMLLSKAYR